MSRAVHLSFAVANIKGNPIMPIGFVRSDLSHLVSLGADITIAVEISNPAYKRAFTDAFTLDGQEIYNLKCEMPTATALKVKRTWITKLVGGVARVTPARYNAGTRIDCDPPVLVLGKHPVSGANRRGAAAANTFGMHIRRALFLTDRNRTSKRIKRANRSGITVVVLMDSNNIRETIYTEHQITAAHAGLMWITVHPAPGVRVAHSPERTVHPLDLHTDHPMLRSDITFIRGR